MVLASRAEARKPPTTLNMFYIIYLFLYLKLDIENNANTFVCSHLTKSIKHLTNMGGNFRSDLNKR